MRSALLFLLPALACGQGFSIGAKGGVPLTDIFEGPGLTGSVPFLTATQRFTFGPAAELRLPFGLGVEVDALYKRFDQTGSGGQVTTGSSWEFPILGKYRFSDSLLRPYIEAGITFNRLTDVLSLNLGSENRKGFAAGAGLELKLPILRLSAGLRYSRLEGKLAIPSTNQADVLFGIMLP